MNKMLKKIYDRYENVSTNENPLEPPELKKVAEKFFNRYFGLFPYDEYDKAWCEWLDIISEYEKNAFETGFYTGIELMKDKKEIIK